MHKYKNETAKRLPNFFILGASKCGTTSLHAYISQHPQIYMPSEKEPHFFDSDRKYAKGVDYYVNTFFTNSGGFLVRGEGTPGYFHRHFKTIPRILETYGGAKTLRFILVFRDPVERAWSHYLHRKRALLENASFEEALRLEEGRLARKPIEWSGYFNCGLYAQQLKEWFKHFSPDSFCFLLTEELHNNPDKAVKKVFRFLCIDDSVPVNTESRKNSASVLRHQRIERFLKNPSFLRTRIIGAAGRAFLSEERRRQIKKALHASNLKPVKHRPVMNKETAARLRAHYEPDIKELQLLIERDLSQWLLKQ